MGYAAFQLGWENIICVFNLAYGVPEDLPFDIRGRSLLKYDSRNKDRRMLRNGFAKHLEKLLREYDPSILIDKNKILKLYKDESHQVKHLALGKTRYWNLFLRTALMRDHFEIIKNRIDEIENNLIFYSPKIFREMEFYRWSVNSLNKFTRAMEVYTSIVERMKLSTDEPIMIKSNVLQVKNLCLSLLDFETEIRSLQVENEYIDPFRQNMVGWGLTFVKQILKMEENFIEIEADLKKGNEKKKHKVVISGVELPLNFQSNYDKLFEWVKNNRYELVEEKPIYDRLDRILDLLEDNV